MEMLYQLKDYAFKQPEKAAFIATEKVMTYKELWMQSERLAAVLNHYGIAAGSPIMVYGHMEPEMLISFLGSVKAGHPYIPVDTSIPLERIEIIANNSQSQILINVSGKPLALENTLIQQITIAELELSNRPVQETNPANWVAGNENFYIIYTSGSTGTPKGVQISADNLQSFVDWMLGDFPITGQKRFLNQAPFSFDLSVMDLYPALASGGSIFAVTKEMIARPKLLFEALKESNTQVWVSTPSFAQMCLMDPSFDHTLLPDLTVFLFCGEILPVAICRQLKDRFPEAKIFNTYGPTEATVAVTAVEITDSIIVQHKTLPVGRPKGDTKILLVNEAGEEVPDGEKGEIMIAGPSVSKGYLGLAERTSKAFCEIGGQWAYRTGDAGYRENGMLFYKGRLDFQIKLHGYRMELEEIEHQLTKSQYVHSAVVIPVSHNDKVDYLMAAIVPAMHDFTKEYQLTSAIKKELSAVLPAYMIPRKFVYENELPMTANGKIDRRLIKEKVML